jgi:hypothetical protein
MKGQTLPEWGWLQKKYPSLKAMPNVVYELQWWDGDEWVSD